MIEKITNVCAFEPLQSDLAFAHHCTPHELRFEVMCDSKLKWNKYDLSHMYIFHAMLYYFVP